MEGVTIVFGCGRKLRIILTSHDQMGLEPRDSKDLIGELYLCHCSRTRLRGFWPIVPMLSWRDAVLC